jgi:competence protein ComEC
VRLLARLQPPNPPALPGGFDFARQAYFEQLGAVGFAIGKTERVAGADDRLGLAVARLRARIAARIMEVDPGPAGAMAAALIAGVRAGIDQATWRAMQVSGLAHLISVSGLHMVLVAGSVFTACRWLLALIPPLALRFPVKRPAAFLALLAAAFYLVLSGASVPTQRSFLMTAIGLVAVMVDRNPFSLRLLAWSALAVLVVRPESVLGASFQLSFAAVLALIAIYEAWGGQGGAEPDDAPKPQRSGVWRYLVGVWLTTLIAGTATTPFAAYHFQTIPTYGVLANLVAVPLTSFVVMPAGLIGLLLMPLGWDALPFQLMAVGVEGVLVTAELVAGLPGAQVLVAQWPVAALVLLAAGGLWLALWQRPWRWLGLAPAAAAALTVALARPPDLVVDGALGMAALRHPDRTVTVVEWQRDRMVRETWLRRFGVAEALPAPRPGEGPSRGIACDPFGCVVTLGEHRVALARRAEAVREDCGGLADLVIARVGSERCAGATPALGPRALAASGGIAVRLDGGDLRVETVAGARGRWPWATGVPSQ